MTVSCPDHPDAPLAHGYGLAGGGMGSYRYCTVCDRIVEKTQDLVMHVTPSEPDCVHDFTTEDGKEPEACTKCGYSFTRYIHGLDIKF